MTQNPNPLAALLAAGVLAVAVIAAGVLVLGHAQAATAQPPSAPLAAPVSEGGQP